MNPNHPLYNMLYGMPQQQRPVYANPTPNPMQQMASVMQAMRNPIAFIKQNLPGIPEEAYNDPSGNAVLQYMMNNMGVSQQDVQNIVNSTPKY